MAKWLTKFKYDPIRPLLKSGNDAVIYFTNKGLFEEKLDTIDFIWNLPEVQIILQRQERDGMWKAFYLWIHKHLMIKNHLKPGYGPHYQFVEFLRDFMVLITEIKH